MRPHVICMLSSMLSSPYTSSVGGPGWDVQGFPQQCSGSLGDVGAFGVYGGWVLAPGDVVVV